MNYDAIIIGGGPAGLSAALTLRARGLSAAVVSNSVSDNPLWKSEKISNYPGMPGITGEQLLSAMTEQARHSGVEFVNARALTAMDTGDGFSVLAGNDVLMGATLILALGVSAKVSFPGESEHLGAGVSYCATCDGMLYRGKSIAVIGRAHDAPEEANALASIGCDVTYFGLNERPADLDSAVKFHAAKKFSIEGDGRVERLVADGTAYPVSGVFILRETVSPAGLLPGLETDNGFIRTDRAMATSIPGVFAAGDCTGRPLQIAKAVGDGNVAALSAAEFIARQKKAAL